MSEPDGHIPTYADVPIGIDATGTRREFDSLGTVDVPADRYWGAQTQRSLEHFSIGNDHMPIEVYRAYGLVKKACAMVNERAGGWRTGGPRSSCRPPTRRSPAGSTTSSRSSSGRPARAPRAT